MSLGDRHFNGTMPVWKVTRCQEGAEDEPTKARSAISRCRHTSPSSWPAPRSLLPSASLRTIWSGVCRRRLFDAMSLSILPCPNTGQQSRITTGPPEGLTSLEKVQSNLRTYTSINVGSHYRCHLATPRTATILVVSQRRPLILPHNCRRFFGTRRRSTVNDRPKYVGVHYRWHGISWPRRVGRWRGTSCGSHLRSHPAMAARASLRCKLGLLRLMVSRQCGPQRPGIRQFRSHASRLCTTATRHDGFHLPASRQR
jgi:hypothetical protein